MRSRNARTEKAEAPDRVARYLARFIRDLEDVNVELLPLLNAVETASVDQKPALLKQAQFKVRESIYLLQKGGH